MDTERKILVRDSVIPATDMLGNRATHRNKAIGFFPTRSRCVRRQQTSIVVHQDLTSSISPVSSGVQLVHRQAFSVTQLSKELVTRTVEVDYEHRSTFITDIENLS